jgi:hypothetical protein
MHSRTTVAEAMALRQEGLGARRIARRMDLPIATVTGWLAGRLPAHSRRPRKMDALRGTCDACGHDVHDFEGLPKSYVYLLGLYLGDGCISAVHRGVYRLRIALDARYPGIIASTAQAVTEIRGREAHVQPQSGNWVVVSGYWKSWPCLFPQHGPGPKHERSIVLTDWQLELVGRWPDQLLRGLIESDGCRFMNTGRGGWVWPRYAFSNKSQDIKEIFCAACDLMGLRWTRSGQKNIYVSRKAYVARLDEFIGPKR